MRDSIPSPRYSPVCNVLRQWKTSLIPTYRVYLYRLYEERRYTDKSNCTRPTRNYYLHVHKEAVTKYMGKWARTVGADRRVLRDWEKTVHECIDERVRFLKQRWLNKRGKSP